MEKMQARIGLADETIQDSHSGPGKSLDHSTRRSWVEPHSPTRPSRVVAQNAM